MRVTLAAIGRMKAGPEKQLADRYLDRFGKAGSAMGLDLRKLAEFPESRQASETERKREEASRLRGAVADGSALWVLDEGGRLPTSEEFAAAISDLRDGGCRDLALAIGGPDGHDDEFRRGADQIISLGKVTFPHQIVRILVAEQLYRAVTILAGHPYHRS